MKWFLDSCNYDCPGSAVLCPSDSSTVSYNVLNKQPFPNYCANRRNNLTNEEFKLEYSQEKLAADMNYEDEQHEDFLEFAFNP